jgi:glutathione S-transferase
MMLSTMTTAATECPIPLSYEAGLTFDRVRADLRAKRAEDGREFNEINPKGYMPALVLDVQLLTDNVAILCWVAERAPGARAGH